MEEVHRARYMGRGMDLPCPLQACHSPQIATCLHTQKLSNRVLLEAYGGSVISTQE